MKIKQIFNLLNRTLITVMIGLSLVLFFNLTKLNENSEWVTHTHEVISHAEHLMASMIDQETGMRGFLATGNKEYLEPYEKEVVEFEHELDTLRKAVSDNPEQLHTLTTIETLSNQWHNQASNVYLSIKEEIVSGKEKRDELRLLTTSGKGKEKMDLIRDLLKSIDDEILRLNILSSMINMETGVRAFIINQEESYLEPYIEGDSDLHKYLEQAESQEITDATHDWIENIGEKEIKLVRELRAYKKDDDLYAELSKETGKQIMDQIRAEVHTFIQVEEELLLSRSKEAENQYQLSITATMIALLAVIVMGVIQNIATNRVTEPLAKFAKEMKAFDLQNIEENITFDHKAVAEVVDLGTGYEALLKELKHNLDEREKSSWIQKGQMKISSIAESYNDLQELLDHLMIFITQTLGAHYSAIYIVNDDSEKKEFVLSSGYALGELSEAKQSYVLGKGLIGQAALGTDIIHINDIPEDYIKIHSGLGNSNPQNLLIVPCRFNDETIAVMEIASLSAYSALMLEFIDKSIAGIGIVINNTLNFKKVQRLLNETSEANEKLKNQQEELRVTNEELKNQSRSLMDSQVELEAQQENLRVLNEELEENSRVLEEQKKTLEGTNKELLESQKTIEEKKEDLVLANKYKSEFLANMSHELRTPLNSILILSELIGESKELSEEEKKYADTINNSGEVLLKLINDILDLSKVEAGQVDLNIAPMKFSNLKNDMLSLFEQVSVKKNLDFKVNLSKDLPESIVTDEMKVKQIINNLLSNAFKFTETGSVILSISKRDDHAVFEVTDTGIGISDDKVELIFGAFKQEDGTTNRKFGGTGLGLSISAEYSKLLGGTIEVESTKGAGSGFILTLPLTIEQSAIKEENLNIDVDDKELETVNEGTEELMSELHEVKYIPDDRNYIDDSDKVLLIIDDDPTFARIVMGISKSNGFKVIVAETGEVGLYLADYYIPSGIILDIGLPGINGWEVLERLKVNNRTKNIPVNIISGKDMDKKVTEAGIQFYQKPVGKEQIESILKETVYDNRKSNKIVVMGVSDNDQNMLFDLTGDIDNSIEVIVGESETATLGIIANQYVDMIILDMDLITDHELAFIKQINENSVNEDVSTFVYTGDDTSHLDVRYLRSIVKDIIIKDGNSTQRLLDEITIFVHKVKENKIDSISNTHDEVMFTDKVVMIVDDDMRNVFALSSILERIGIKTEVAINGKEAIDMLQNDNNIDLILMDIMMPIMDGYEAMRAIRKMNKYKSLPIIALTAKAMKGDRDACIEAGANEYLTKPIDKNKLLSLLRVWI